MEKVKRRPRETSQAHRARSAEASAASRETKKKETEDAHAPWKKAWEKETGKKYGIATHGAYTSWLAEKRKARAAKAKPAPDSVSAQDAGDAIAKDKKKSE